MDFLHGIVDLFLHLDRHLGEILNTYGAWTYAILALVVFLETGLVATPFLPGDSLLFAAGAFAALGSLDLWVLLVLLSAAAIAGDSLNYWIGRRVGPRVFTDRVRWLKREHLVRTQEFYERHGGKTIVLARFVPIVRTFAPFVAGIGAMPYRRFFAYNVLGGLLWVGLLVPAGFYFGNLPVVRENFSLVILAIIGVSLLPLVIEYIRQRRAAVPPA
ncbi:MAG TPA: DedA family protein [Candidatus Polarisedimenticolia bacterium]|nr:DedA family protein [Candidatus Polarisedimenticolia bacterium]